ncbi:MAG: PAS domain S-box protein [Desulfobulbaceae bacterium]|nr:PAS domain S-box protein [Desulfobulbaceae bacterium]
MKVKALGYYIASVMVVALIGRFFHSFFPIQKLYHVPFHAGIEAMGGIAALNLAALLFLKSKKRGRSYFPLAQSGLICMGILDLFHSLATPGESFIWLHSIATFSGGLFFSLVWVPEKILKSKTVAALPPVVLFVAIIVGLSAFVFPKAVPAMLVQEHFSLTAKWLNSLGGLLFLVASVWFFNKYRIYRKRFDELLFANCCFLFGIAGILFDFSQLWNWEWWIWHVVRLFSYALALFYLFENFRRTEITLQESEDRYRSLVENSPDIIYIFSNKRGGLYYSQKAENILGYSNEELLRNSFIWHDSIHPENLPAVDAAIHAFNKGSTYEIEYRIRDRHDNWHWFLDRFIRKSQEGDEIIIEGLATDITERKRWEEMLSESEATSRSIYETSPMLMGVVELTEDDKIVHIYDNPATARFFNVEYKGTKNRTADELGAPSEAISEWLVGYRQSQQQGKPVQFEYVHSAPDGPLWLSATVSLIGPGHNGRTRFSYVAEEITSRKRTDEALRTSEAFLNAILDQSPFSAWISDDKGTLIRLNEACRNLLNITDEDVLGKYNVLQDNIVEKQGFMPLVKRVFKAGEAAKFELQYDSSQLKHLQLSNFASVVLDVTIFPIKDQHGKVTNAVIQHRDITPQRNAEAGLLESEERLRQAVRVSHIGIFNHNHLTDEYYWSPEYLQIYGLDKTPPMPEFINLIHPEDRDMIAAAVRRAHDPAGDGKFDVEFRNMIRGREIRWISTRSQTFFAGEGSERHPIRTVGAVQDITERKNTEIKLKEYADTQAALLREVNHRVKNNLAVIIGMLHKEEDVAKSKRQTSFLPLLHDLEGRIKGLLTVHSMFSATNWQPLLLGQLCQRIISGIMKPYGPDISLNISASETLVDSDQAHHLSMVINELATNSLKYTLSEPVRICIDVDIKEDAGKIFLTFRDNGPGYPDNIISGEYAETSIGFNLISGIVKKSLRGDISFRNENGAVAEIIFDKSVTTGRDGQ